MVWNLFPFKGDFSFGKSQKLQSAKSGLYWDWVTWVIWCFTKKLQEMWCTGGEVSPWSCQSPVAHSYGLLNHLNSFHGGMFKLNAKLDADLLLYLLSHFECDSHTVHMLTQWHLLPPLTSKAKWPLFMHAHFQSPLLGCPVTSCHANHSHYINNGWTFSRQTAYNFKETIKSVL